MSKTLDTLEVGAKGKVVAVGGLHTSLRIELMVRGYALTMRKEDAKLIEIA